MTPIETEKLVRETMEFSGSASPALMQADAPVLDSSALSDGNEAYFIGLIGGKEVGKSALVNALVGSNITEQTSHGPGTEMVIAFAHESQEQALKKKLAEIVPGKFRVVMHTNLALARQVLLDLPDIDSRFSEHLELTRTMLRFMLFPIWVQSIEKYADAQPQALLAKVAAGNDPSNFLFCLNKADQLPAADGGLSSEAEEIRADYSDRISRVLQLPAAPRVFLISAISPGRFELPELRQLISQAKSEQAVASSRQAASRQRERSLLTWLRAQKLDTRRESLGRLRDMATESLADRVGSSLMESVIPEILDDADYRALMAEGVLAARVARWPLVNIVHAILSPLRFALRENIGTARPGARGVDSLVDAHLSQRKPSIAARVQSTFAQLHQSFPSMAALFTGRKLWESMEADVAETQLRSALGATVRRQRDEVMHRLARRRGVISPFFRFILTIGAVLWFVLVQPVLEIVLHNSVSWTLRSTALFAVDLFSTQFLLENLAFIVLWLLVLWGWIRWDTRRRVDRLLSRWKALDATDLSLNLPTVCLMWIDELIEPISTEHDRVTDLMSRIDDLEKQVGQFEKNEE